MVRTVNGSWKTFSGTCSLARKFQDAATFFSRLWEDDARDAITKCDKRKIAHRRKWNVRRAASSLYKPNVVFHIPALTHPEIYVLANQLVSLIRFVVRIYMFIRNGNCKAKSSIDDVARGKYRAQSAEWCYSYRWPQQVQKFLIEERQVAFACAYIVAHCGKNAHLLTVISVRSTPRTVSR